MLYSLIFISLDLTQQQVLQNTQESFHPNDYPRVFVGFVSHNQEIKKNHLLLSWMFLAMWKFPMD